MEQKRQDKWKTNNRVDLNLTTSSTTLNLNSLNNPTKRQRSSEWI